jgi:DNA-binding transcriptional regulator GbsR (MarR family)
MKKSKINWNYAVIKSLFGDLWIGKTKLKANKKYIFDNLDDVSQFAIQLFEDNHIDFDASLDDTDENYNDELLCQFEELANSIEDEIEEIKKGIEKFIVRN